MTQGFPIASEAERRRDFLSDSHLPEICWPRDFEFFNRIGQKATVEPDPQIRQIAGRRSSFDYLVGAQEDRLWDHGSHYLCSLNMDCGAPASRSDFAAELIRLSLRPGELQGALFLKIPL